MKFDKEINSLLKEFNVYPQYQTAPSTGPDQGMTSGDMQNTFPQKMDMVPITLPKKKDLKKKSINVSKKRV